MLELERRLGRVFELTLPKLGPEARGQLESLINPASLKIIAGVIGAWVIGHAFGVGEVIDAVVFVAGAAAVGMAVFSGIDELFLFAKLTWRSGTDADLSDASAHLARAIAILGIQVVMTMLCKKLPRGGRMEAGEPPPAGEGLRYKPSTVADPSLPAGEGATTFWGDIEVSLSGSADDQAIVLLHEKVHQALAPKFYVLRRFRVENRVGSYFNSSLYRYLEESLAETVAQIGVNGLSRAFIGMRFPVSNGYVFLTRAGGFSAYMKGAGLLPETVALLGSGALQGFAYEVWFGQDRSGANTLAGSSGTR
jgi:hypothetical protein